MGEAYKERFSNRHGADSKICRLFARLALSLPLIVRWHQWWRRGYKQFLGRRASRNPHVRLRLACTSSGHLTSSLMLVP